MRFVKQKFRHDPDNGIYGDCYRTAVACLLDIDPEEIPHEHRKMEPGEQDRLMDAFLAERSITRICVPFSAESVEAALAACCVWGNGLPYLLSGKSHNDVGHVVIGQGLAIIHDPAQDESGIVGPATECGHYFVEWLVPSTIPFAE